MSSKKTYLSITNDTTQSFTIAVSQVDSYDWEGKNRPDRNFEGKTVKPGETLKEQEDLNSHAKSAWFRFTLTFSSGQTVSFRSDQYDALGKNINDHKCDLNESEKYVYSVSQSTNKSGSLNSFSVEYLPYSLTSQKWMKKINGNYLISNFGIPGTNLSASCMEKAGIYRTQDICQDTQLAQGIRYFDLYATVKNEKIYLSFSPNTNIIGKGNLFDYLIRSFLKFLNDHPTETIIVSLCETGTPSPTFAETVISYLQKYSDRIYSKDSIPTLDDVRNKIVILRRFAYKHVYGLNIYDGWPANGTNSFSYRSSIGQYASFSVQNNTTALSVSQKFSDIKDSLKHVNFNNGTFAINNSYVEPMFADFNLKSYARYLNADILNYLQNTPHVSNVGALLLLYPDETSSLLSTLIKKITEK